MPFGLSKEKVDVENYIKSKREQELVYTIAKEMMERYYHDEDGSPNLEYFSQLLKIIKEWYQTKVKTMGYPDTEYKKLLYFYNPQEITKHIYDAITVTQIDKDRIIPIFNYYNPIISTSIVNNNTSKPVEELYETTKSHINYVVADTQSWEQQMAIWLEELDCVQSYVKNSFLNFKIPFTNSKNKDANYMPDFIAICSLENGETANVVIELTGSNLDEKENKILYAQNYWVPAVNNDTKYNLGKWSFLHIRGEDEYKDFKRIFLEHLKGLKHGH